MTNDETLPEALARKFFTREAAHREFGPARSDRVVFTNGCFDLIHRGHVELFLAARALGDRLVVGLNSDASVTRLKGPGRPLMPEPDRVACLAALESVDGVVVFEEDTPAALIEELQPDILVKGGDYEVEQVLGRDTVEARGGRVVIVPFLPGRSTTEIMQSAAKIRDEPR
ncbi:MAG: D-glycero-beta-D-manno-heptose 1-phosphate adenylyltransferase [Candidatus Palauibacterales bacterium]|nr:D-glycero-beta-D-manno-heptose 1-phosphate adenylyltransferase [Candidatus Palauibacterales bacterium]